MAKIDINAINNANVYINGTNLLGRTEEITLPDISMIVQERKALGIVGKIELPFGFDKMEGTIKWNSFYPDVGKLVANPFKSHQLQCRSNVQRYGSQGIIEEVPMVTWLTVMFKKNPMGAYKQHESPDFTSGFSCTYVKQVFDGDDIIELDVLANIFKVNGEDMLADYRANIGA